MSNHEEWCCGSHADGLCIAESDLNEEFCPQCGGKIPSYTNHAPRDGHWICTNEWHKVV